MKRVMSVMILFLLFTIDHSLAFMGGHMMGQGMMKEDQHSSDSKSSKQSGWMYPDTDMMTGLGMMGGGDMMKRAGKGRITDSQIEKYLDDTRELRKKILLKKYEYFEAARDPVAPQEIINKLQREIKNLMIILLEKAPDGYFLNW